MRIIFMGTPDFAVSSLEALIHSKHEVVEVFCQPDKPKGRGHKMQAPPVKELALDHNITVSQPTTLKDEEVQQQIRAQNADLIVVVAYGKILPRAVLETPKFGCINVHGSLLPKYRGSAPIQWAVINGEETTGVTTMFMGEGVDTGNMLLKSETKIGADETSGELFDRLKEMGAKLLIETIDVLENGNIEETVQNEDEATHAPMLKKEDAKIDWNQEAIKIKHLIYGMNPWPSAYAVIDGKKMKIHRAELVEYSGNAGDIDIIDKEFIVYCKEKALKLTEIQPENSKRMDGRSYLLGHDVKGKSFEIN